MFFAVRRIELSEKEPALREVDVFRVKRAFLRTAKYQGKI